MFTAATTAEIAMRYAPNHDANPVRPQEPERGWLLVFIAALVVIAAIGGLQ